MHTASQSGFSLLEVLVALIVLTIGVFAATRSLAVMSRTLASASVLTNVAVLGTNEMETLLAPGCEAATGTGETSNHGVRANWLAQSNPGSVRLRVTLRYPLASASRMDSIVHFLSCPDEA